MKKKILKKTKIKTTKRVYRRTKKSSNGFLTLGMVNPSQGRILILMLSIIFLTTVLTMSQAIEKVEKQNAVPEMPVRARVAKINPIANEVTEMVKGYPIEKMTPYILKQDPKVAAFLVAIAKKESAWGKRIPVLDGEDCYNYWGFRLKSDRMGSGGHTCFDSPEEAVEIVASRLNHLVNEEQIDTPKEMVIWKCGYACNGPEATGSQKWIKDVDYYYSQMIN